MGIHAQTSPEALAKLAVQRKKSTITSVIVGLLVMILFVLLFWLIGIKNFSNKIEPIVAYPSDELTEEVVEKVRVTNLVKKAPAPPSSSASPVIASSSPSTFTVPVPEIFVDSITPDFGESEGFGDNFGDSYGNGFVGSAFTSLPASMKIRCSPSERLARLKETGGNKKCEEAVVKSLKWLKRTQNADGSWTLELRQVSMTGFALLCYLGHCETPLSYGYGASVEKAIIYLINLSKNNGGFLRRRQDTPKQDNDAGWLRAHVIATYALAEAYTFCKIISYEIEGLEGALFKAANIIVTAQKARGDWIRYERIPPGIDSYYNAHVNYPMTCWCLQALKACKATGLKIPGLVVAGKAGIEWLKLWQNQSEDFFGFKTPGFGIAVKTKSDAFIKEAGYRTYVKHTLTGAGLLCMQQWGEGKSKEARDAAEWLETNTPFEWAGGSMHLLHSHYYNGQVFMRIGGQSWEDYNKRCRDEVLSAQAANGSYTDPGRRVIYTHPHGHDLNPHGSIHCSTCLTTLMLQVYYSFLPATSEK